jgi:hypothetical protein
MVPLLRLIFSGCERCGHKLCGRSQRESLLTKSGTGPRSPLALGNKDGMLVVPFQREELAEARTTNR